MKVIKNIIFVVIVVSISIGLLVVGNGYDMYKDAISKMPLTEKVETIKEKENYTKIEELPEIYIKAVISVEDHRFYKHHGIDIIAIGRATINDIKAMSFVEGGSTITQQLSKNIYFTQEKKITRKIAEVFMSFEIEKNYNKDEILELYLNTSYFGEGCYTVKEASRKYFGKEPKEMTDYEAILLAGIPNAPSVYAPTKNPELAKQRQKQVMNKMIKYDYLTHLALECANKTQEPSFISAKKMRENYEGNVFSPMGCRSFLSPWKDENENYKFEGRFNQGVVSINLPQIAIIADGDEEKFWKLLDERLELCKEALMCRHYALLGISSDISPIHWQYGAIARLKKSEKIDKLLYGGYSTMSLGYIGIYEMTKLMKGVSHTTPEGHEFALKVIKHLRETTDKWKKETNIGFALYGTPAESLCYKFARVDKEKYGTIKDVTDKGYYTNSYHVDVREKIDAFEKLTFESEFQKISSGGAISYVEIPNMQHNILALETAVKFIYDNIQYAEFNTKSDYCHVCGFNGEIIINDNNEWECPNCGNKDHSKMNVVRRTCGYLGENFWNAGKTKEIKQRVLHM